MRKILVISGILFLLGTLVALFIIMKQLHKPHIDIYATDPDITISINTLLNDYNIDEKKANQKYLDKVIQTEGIIKKIDINNGNTLILITEKNTSNSVVCYMEPFENKKVLTLEVGQSIKVKGICTGFLMDVVLVRTIIIH